MIKKLMALTLLLLLIFSTGLSFATAAPATTQTAGARYAPIPVVARWKIMNINRNQENIRAMNAAVENKTMELKKKIEDLRTAPKDLKPEKIILLKESTQLLAEKQKRFAAGQGFYKSKMEAVRVHKRAGNRQAALAGLDGILEAQQEQIRNLRALSSCLDRLILLL
jgi:peptidoglycan hydrolase CwlO-like protein